MLYLLTLAQPPQGAGLAIGVLTRREVVMETKELFKEVQALRHKICLVVSEQDSLEDDANIALVRAMVKWEGETIHALTLKEV